MSGRRITHFCAWSVCSVALILSNPRPAAASWPISGTPIALPGVVQAADYDGGGEYDAYYDTTPGNSGNIYRTDDVDIEYSSEGGYDIGWTAAGEWLNYSVNVLSSGSYTVQLRVASPYGGALHIGFNQSGVWSVVNVPNTGGWQNWTTVNLPVTLNAGYQILTILFDTGKTNTAYVNVVPARGASSGGGLSPFNGTPAAIPGTIAASDFDNGGEGVAYHDTTAGNNGGVYRFTEDVDLEASTEGGYDVGWIAAGEWLNYTVNVTSSGSYTVYLRTASIGGGSLHIGFNGSGVWNTVSVPNSGGWQNWTTVSFNANLTAGTQVMTLLFDTNGFNVLSVAVASGSSSGAGSPPPPPPGPPPSSNGGSTDTVVVTWNADVLNYTTPASQNVIDAAMGISPRPQILILEEAHQSQFGTYIGELQAVTGQTWYGAFQTHCSPGGWNGSWCTASDDEGVGVFTTLPIIASEGALLPWADCWHSARAVVHAMVNVNGTTLQVFGTHLQTGGCTDVASARYNSIQSIKAWAANWGGPQIVGGDFNAGPDQVDSPMSPNFIDSWSVVGSGIAMTAFTPSPTFQLDFLFEDASGKAQPQWTQVVTSTGTISDHNPMMVLYRIFP
jgi:endonuclease/exonuclease/phosphatase family metal-dependent hydrolase